MTYRTRYRLSAIPFALVTICFVAFAAMWFGPLQEWLAIRWQMLPLLVMAISSIIPLGFLSWYLTSYAEVRRSRLVVRSAFRMRLVDLKLLTAAEVRPKPSGSGSDGRADRGTYGMFLSDEVGHQLWVPLETWRDEDLLMARVLRATVDCRVRIEGDPILVKRFSGLLESYKSWDRQLAA